MINIETKIITPNHFSIRKWKNQPKNYNNKSINWRKLSKDNKQNAIYREYLVGLIKNMPLLFRWLSLIKKLEVLLQNQWLKINLMEKGNTSRKKSKNNEKV